MPADETFRELERERRRQLVRAAIAMLGLLGLPATLENVALFHAYVSESPREVKQAIDEALKTRPRLEQADLDALHERFRGQLSPVDLDEDREPFAVSFRSARRHLRQAHDATLAFTNQLSGHAEGVLDAAQEALGVLTNETRSSREQVVRLEERLSETMTVLQAFMERLERAERFAATDALTELANRRSFEERLRVAVRKAREQNQRLSMLMVDVDRFKDFNDRHGHDVGDHVLRLIARTLAAHAGDEQLAARYGGEEFAVLLPGVGLKAAKRLAETLCKALTKRRLTMRGSGRPLGNVTVSVGVAELRPEDGPDNLVRRADVALYRAKQQGRNRVVADESA